MKKQIALIIVSMLAAMSVAAQNVNENSCKNEMCRNYNTPICEMGEGVIQPNLECILGLCPDIPDIGVKPEIPDIEIKPDIPEVPEIPNVPEVPEVPEIPNVPEVPEVPEIPNVPELPDTPVLPDEPEQTPDTETETPDTPMAMQVFSIVNAERAKYGLAPLTYDSHLARAADIRSVEIKSYFSHTRPNGTSCFTALDEIGYNYRSAGENIAYGQRSAEEVMNAWMNSEGHRANILGNYTYIGIGVYEQGGVIYWSQFFAS